MTSVITALQHRSNALLESPTGTGKTLSLLCSSLGWLQSKSQLDTEKQAKKQQILYCSRTHSQLSQVIHEFKKTYYSSSMGMAVLGSREHLCVHSQVSAQPTGTVNAHCAQLRADNKCRFYRSTSKYIATERGQTKGQPFLKDIEELCNDARQDTFCPYFLERELAVEADIIFLPYSYILDQRMHSQLPTTLEDAIVIIDEAHNVPSALTSSASHSLTQVDISSCIRDLDHSISLLESQVATLANPNNPSILWVSEQAKKTNIDQGDSEKISPNELLGLTAGAKLLLLKLEKAIHGESMPAGQSEIDQPGMKMQLFLELNGISSVSYLGNGRNLRGLLHTVTHLLGTLNETTASSIRLNGDGLKKVNDFLSAVLETHLTEEEINVSCRYVIQESQSSRTLSFWCLDVSLSMKNLCLPLRQVLLTSGTLSPIEHFATELGIPFEVVYQSRHVINTREQLRSFVLKAGPNGDPLNGSFAFRSNDAYHSALGASVLNLSAVTPDGLLVFFPSYASMNGALNSWKSQLINGSTLYGHLSAQKKIFVEPATTSELSAVVTEYKQTCLKPGGAILIGVCRGKISEGIDFADRHARGVFVTGIPFANTSDLFVRLKRRYLTATARNKKVSSSGELFTGDYWYKNEALRSVNQCIGRVIRNKNDFGVIVLADERFCSHLQALSTWVTFDENQQPTISVTSQFQECYTSVMNFFRNYRKVPDERAPSPSNVTKVLQTPHSVDAMNYHLKSMSNESNTKKSAQSTEATSIKFSDVFKKTAPLELPDSKSLISQLKLELHADEYQKFRASLQLLVVHKKNGTPPLSVEIKAIIEEIVTILSQSLSPERFLVVGKCFRSFTGVFYALYDQTFLEKATSLGLQ